MAEQSVRRPLRVAVVDAPSARPASLASSAASRHMLGMLHSEALDLPGIPPGNPPGIPPARDGGGHPFRLGRIDAGQVPFGGPVGRKNRGRLAPLGGVERPRRVVRFARLIHRRVRDLGRAFGPHRLQRHSAPVRIAPQGGGAA